MDLIDNVNRRLGDDLTSELRSERRLQIAASRFSIFAFDALRQALERCDGLDFLFTLPSFLPGTATDAATPEVRRYHLKPPLASLTVAYEIHLRNRLSQKAVARDCAVWLRENARMRSNATSTPMQQFGLVADPAGGGVAYHPLQGFTAADLGYERGEAVSNLVTRGDAADFVAPFRTLFDQLWNDPSRTVDVTDAVCDHIARVYRENPPRRIYHLMLLQLFREHLESLSPDDAANRRTGYRESLVWQKLYDFQADAAHGLIQKLQTYDGCVLADSVGLGKTFTALAVVKYYELRNKSVLVLCPRKLAENWTNYNNNYRTNPFREDRFGYDVLCHTDLLRDRGESLGMQLDRIAWGNYDLVVIDESHNFRNVNPSRRRETRYDRLLQRVIRDGVRTKVLMLSATPVNNRFADLKNQLLLAYGGDTQRLREHLPDGGDVEDIFRRAQTAFNRWSELPTAERTPRAILDLLDFDFFDLLDRVTIARSRRQIERFYDTAKLGGFPERLAPKAVHSRLTSRTDVMGFNDIYAELSLMNLAVYTPLSYVLASRRDAYEALFDTDVEGGRTLTASGREAGLRALMTTNLLKRLESSVHAFRLTLAKLSVALDDRLAKIAAFEADGTDAEVDGPTYEPGDDDDDDEESGDPIERRPIRIRLSDMDLPRWRDDLTADRERVEGLAVEMAKVTSEVDSKLQDLRQAIQSKLASPINPGNRKVLVFTAFADTAVYLYEQLAEAHRAEHGLHAAVVTGDKRQIANTLRPNRKGRAGFGFAELLTLFSPRSKEKAVLLPDVDGEIDLLIATDCISEGQNLQDCDCLVNYDIHWNPVRIVQRFGRIDRIGSTNRRIQLINHWPDITLDEYINLKDRVENRMVIVDATATADDNPLDTAPPLDDASEAGSDESEDSYRGEQLRRMHGQVVELEDLRTGVSITDLGLNDYHLELQGTLEEEPDLSELPAGLHAVVPADPARGLPAGMVFALRQRGGDVDRSGSGYAPTRSRASHRLHPHYLVYVADDSSVVQTHTDVKPLLDVVRLAARDRAVPVTDACESFNARTDDGRDMSDCSRLLDAAVASVIGRQAEGEVDALFADGGLGGADRATRADDFELMSFLVVEDLSETHAAGGAGRAT